MILKPLSERDSHSETPIQCPLCNSSSQLDHLTDLDVQRIITRWRQTYNIDPTGEVGTCRQIALYRCCNCQLLFYFPFIIGSNQFYSDLQRYDWYYMADKWEFQAALQDIQPGMRCLEIGCGTGEFVRMALNRGIHAEGIELNTSAVQTALENNLPVSNRDLADLAEGNLYKYDVICAFQVLEHVGELRVFLDCCIRLLRSGGILLFSVPNEGSFLQHDVDNLLNQPPHHVSRWSRLTLTNLQKFYPLELQRVAYEPLAAYHTDWYISVQKGRLPDHSRLGRLSRRTLCSVYDRVIVPSSLYRLIRGHTIYASFQKTVR